MLDAKCDYKSDTPTATLATARLSPEGTDRLGKLPVSAHVSARRRASDASEQFESLFILQMMREMKKAVREISPEGSIFRNETTAAMLDFMDMTLADSLARQRVFGIADVILRQVSPDPATPVASTFKPWNLRPRSDENFQERDA